MSPHVRPLSPSPLADGTPRLGGPHSRWHEPQRLRRRSVGCTASIGARGLSPRHRLSGRVGSAPAPPSIQGEHDRDTIAVAEEEPEVTRPEPTSSSVF